MNKQQVSARKVKKNTRKNITMIEKFEIACLIGTHTLAYIEVDNAKRQFMRQPGNNDDYVIRNLDVQARVV